MPAFLFFQVKENSSTFGLIQENGAVQRKNRFVTNPRENIARVPTDFDSIVEHFAERIFNQALRVLGNREDAEEAATDAFMRIHRGLSDFRGESQLSTWIWRITANVCLTRKARRRVQMVSLDAGEFRDDPRYGEPDSNPEERFLAQEGGEELAGLIAELPDQEASAIALFYLQEMKYNEISAILQIPPGTVATLLHRGRERLRKRIHSERKKP